jgi:hypothetical protein
MWELPERIGQRRIPGRAKATRPMLPGIPRNLPRAAKRMRKLRVLNEPERAVGRRAVLRGPDAGALIMIGYMVERVRVNYSY